MKSGMKIRHSKKVTLNTKTKIPLFSDNLPILSLGGLYKKKYKRRRKIKRKKYTKIKIAKTKDNYEPSLGEELMKISKLLN